MRLSALAALRRDREQLRYGMRVAHQREGRGSSMERLCSSYGLGVTEVLDGCGSGMGPLWPTYRVGVAQVKDGHGLGMGWGRSGM